MEHDEAIRAAARLAPLETVDALRALDAADQSSGDRPWPLALITSIWEEAATLRGDRKHIYRVFVRHICSEKLARVGWMMDDGIASCVLCGSAFGIFNGRSHCRACGNLICRSCKLEAHIEEHEIRGPMAVCRQCCFGQDVVKAQTSVPSSALPIYIGDLWSWRSYQFLLATPSCVLTGISQAVPIYVNICASRDVPSELMESHSFHTPLCGSVRRGFGCMVADIMLSPTLASTCVGRGLRHALSSGPSIHDQIIRFLHIFFDTDLITLDVAPMRYFDPCKAIGENAGPALHNVGVRFPIPPLCVFETYVQVPVFHAEDVIRVEVLEATRAPEIEAQETDSEVRDDDSATRIGMGFEEQSTPRSKSSFGLRSLLKAFSKSSSFSTDGANERTHGISLTWSGEEAVDFSRPLHVQALVAATYVDPLKNSPHTNAGLRTPRARSAKISSPRSTVAGTEGRERLTPDMLEVLREEGVDPTIASQLSDQSKKDKTILLGWQVLVRSADGKECKGVYVITGHRRTNGASMYRLSNFEELDQWVPLTRKMHGKGFVYTPLRQVI